MHGGVNGVSMLHSQSDLFSSVLTNSEVSQQLGVLIHCFRLTAAAAAAAEVDVYVGDADRHNR